MNISLLADNQNEAVAIAKWYFDEWDHRDPNATLESVTEKVLSGANRKDIPITFVAHINGELVGAGDLKYCEIPAFSNYSYWVDGIYVDPAHRGKGISTALIEFAKAKAVELNRLPVYLRCEQHLVELYKAHSFDVVEIAQDKTIMVFNPSS